MRKTRLFMVFAFMVALVLTAGPALAGANGSERGRAKLNANGVGCERGRAKLNA
jgi:hypothetical protein